MAHRDLAEFYRAIGDYQTALKHYAKLREYCTTSQHVLDMCIAVLELLIEQRNYAHIPTYVFKAEPALDASTNALRSTTYTSASSAATPHAAATAAQASKDRLMNERQKTQTKLEVATGISHLGLGSYEKAASAFLRAGSAVSLGIWASRVRGTEPDVMNTCIIADPLRPIFTGYPSVRCRDLRSIVCSCDVPEAAN